MGRLGSWPIDLIQIFQSKVSPFINRSCFIVFLLFAAVCLASLLTGVEAQAGFWMPATLLALGTATTTVHLSRTLPVQNILAAFLLIAILSDLAQLAGLKAGCFVAPLSYLDASSHKTFNPFLTPLAWVVAILNSRGVARLILRPWRTSPNYGLWGIALTCALVFVLDACLDIADWHIDDWQATAACLVSTVFIVVLAVPWLINKRPTPQPPPDWQPFIVWQTLNLLLAVAEAVHHAPSATALHLIAGAIVGIAVTPIVSSRAVPASS